MGNHSDIVDAAHWHAYTQNGQLPYPNMLEGAQKTPQLAVAKPFWFTEFGCSNYNGSQGWGSCGDANITAPRLVLNYFADAFLVGAQKAIYYELFDGTATYTTADDIENNFGAVQEGWHGKAASHGNA